MQPHPATLIVLTLLAACSPAADSEDPSSWSPRGDPAETVVLITMDSVNARVMLGEEWAWEVMPTLSAFHERSVLFDHVLTTRGVTQVALSSLLTGLYPKNHGVRGNEMDSDDAFAVRLPSLLRRFQDAGYRTYGFSANQCQLIDAYVDERACTWERELEDDLSMSNRDRRLVDELVATLSDTPEDERVFLWLHLNNPHKPWDADREALAEFHPQAYEGVLSPQSEGSLDQVTLGQTGYDTLDRAWVEATYASQLRDTDAQIERVFESLRALDRFDDAVIAVGVDHGEELAAHADYFWHGCSPYSSVLRVVYAVSSPLLPQGWRHGDWVSSADIAPTLVDLASAFPWEGDRDGRSLASAVIDGESTQGPVYFERTPETAGMILEGHKVILSSEEGFDGCTPYNATPGVQYPSRTLELYDLDSDPGEVHDLAEVEPELAEELEREVCTWITSGSWVDESHPSENLLAQCEELLGEN
jgi:arylsulfatase A-like enzyme